MTPDPDLTADVEHWLTDQIRTNWPNITADVLDDDERPAVAAWFATEITRFEAWRREQGSGGTGMPPEPSAGTEAAIWNSSKNGRRIVGMLPGTTMRAGRVPVLHEGEWKVVRAIDISGFVEPLTKPPTPGSHESDYTRPGRRLRTTAEVEEYLCARRWSRANRTTERTA